MNPFCAVSEMTSSQHLKEKAKITYVCPCIPSITLSVTVLVSSTMLHLLRVEFSCPLKTLCSTDATRRHRNPSLLHCHSWLCHWRSPVNLDGVEVYPPDYIQHRSCYCARLARQERAVWVWEVSPCPEAAPISQSKCLEKTWCAWVAVSIQKHLCVFLTFISSCCCQLYSCITVINWGFLKKN